MLKYLSLSFDIMLHFTLMLYDVKVAWTVLLS